ncbi:hypothetical protein OWR29_39505 [Actinoplanes sp. Pm04-4]|uniref:Transcriptional regulator n=1 Tax=Paractinoplanes pyxinae TaxID=2997416 RepID=A0ABT4BC71_9ACTN|nr:hypothetical protein [Actinoplanes pyxinae]MCY1144119.1 hypothetical protein [Actinoplanes pyxinae]
MAGTQRPIANSCLAGLITEADISHAALARQVNQLARRAEHGGLDLRYDSSSVHRWLRGAVPAPPAPQLIAAVLTRRLHRVITSDDVLDDGVAYLALPDTADATTASATSLWHRIAMRREAIRYPFVAAAGPEAGWRWAFGPAAANVSRSGTRRVGMSDVDRILAARSDFADLDRRHGGGYARAWLSDYLDHEVTPLLHGTYRDTVGRALFAAAAVLTETVSYMAFDAGEQGLSQRLSIQGLALAKHAGDTAFGAYVMSNMAAQLVYLGDGAKAAQMARAASASARRAPAALLARIHTTEARGHALAHDAGECRTSLRRAETALARSIPDSAPSWLGASSLAHHAGSTMHCLHDLGQFAEADKYSTAALDLPTDSIRARALHQILHARVQAGLGDIEHSCHTARSALLATGHLRSRRLRDRIHEYTAGLTAHGQHSAVLSWKSEARELLGAA